MKLTTLGLALLLPLPTAAALDLHRVWEDRCQECHGHAGDFARNYLKVEGGALVGRHHTSDLKRFLGQHQMDATIAGEIYDMLLAQAQSKPIFQQKCSSCHGTAASFARSSLSMQDGVLIGREKQQPVVDILQQHGKLSPEDVPAVVNSLTRVLKEVGGAPAG